MLQITPQMRVLVALQPVDFRNGIDGLVRVCNPFDYLTALQRHADEVAAAPVAWLPWNYRDQFADASA
jgi:hypothetical protein